MSIRTKAILAVVAATIGASLLLTGFTWLLMTNNLWKAGWLFPVALMIYLGANVYEDTKVWLTHRALKKARQKK